MTNLIPDLQKDLIDYLESDVLIHYNIKNCSKVSCLKNYLQCIDDTLQKIISQQDIYYKFAFELWNKYSTIEQNAVILQPILDKLVIIIKQFQECFLNMKNKGINLEDINISVHKFDVQILNLVVLLRKIPHTKSPKYRQILQDKIYDDLINFMFQEIIPNISS